MEIGSKIYYEKSTGNVVLTVGDMQGFIVESTFDDDFLTYTKLKDYNKDQIGLIKLEFGQLSKLLEENKANSYKVDVSKQTHELVFKYIDYDTGKEVEPPKTIEEIIEEKINAAKVENALGVAELAEKQEKDKLELSTALVELTEQVLNR